MYGREKAWGEPDWARRWGYRVLGELHMPGRLRAWHIIQELRRLGLWSPRPLALLDAGGGRGAFAYFVARKFPAWTVVVADNDAETLERGWRVKEHLGLGNLEMRNIDLRRFDDERLYDVIVCSDVLEHIEEDELAVKHLSRVLRPGGILIISAPSVPQPKHLALVAWLEQRRGFAPSDYGHVRQGYSPEDLRRLMRHAGLEEDQMRCTFGPFGTLMFDLFFVTGDSRPHPLLYAALFPVYMGLSILDVALPARHGAGILGVGRKP